MTASRPIVLAWGSDREDELWERVRQTTADLEFQMVNAFEEEPLCAAVIRLEADAILVSWGADPASNARTIGAIREVKRKENLYQIPVLVVAGLPTLDDGEVAHMIASGVEDCIRHRTAQILLKSRLCNSLKTKFYYDFILKVTREAALRDPLTGLWNHRQFQEQIRLEISRAKRSRSAISLVLMDIDNFKNVNDTYGHMEGDRVLKEAALALQSSMRAGDILARYGGEEFVAILPGLDRAGAFEVVDRIRQALRRVRIHAPDALGRHVTLSAGIACFPDDAEEVDELIHASDMALLRSKAAGRDRVESVRFASFEYKPDHDADFVGVAGPWNAWMAVADPLMRDEDGTWRARRLLPTGQLSYKYLVKRKSNGVEGKVEWLTDPDNPRKAPDGFGNFNSIITVKGYPPIPRKKPGAEQSMENSVVTT